ncbi:MAG TPA: heparan-alpha-glucosaminide N-acetyltransferase [Ramlibacter sp.]|nr:heparan-alpha-glucosaminide N-acetyltransferase [Ramlibacter sp.]
MPDAQRYDSIDALRGVAIVWMTLFHFSFDLNYFHWIHQDFYGDALWTGQRTAIVSLFLFCAGLGQAVAVEQAQAWQRFWRRWLQVAGCAVLVTIGSYFMFPRSFIYFGVLHGIALMLVATRSTANWGRVLWIAGAIAIAMNWIGAWAIAQWPSLDFLNDRSWNWLGITSRKPITEDYVPLIPWLGVMGWGMATGQWLLAKHRRFVAMRMPKATAPLSWLGRWSLTWYMVHQPVMIGALTAVQALR